MSKEDLNKRIAQHKQIILGSEVLELTRKETQKINNERDEELVRVNKRSEIEAKIAKTREIFSGSGIIETLEEIRDSQVVILEHVHLGSGKMEGRLFHKHWVADYKTEPARIKYDLDEVRMDYDYWSFWNGSDHSDVETGTTCIFIKKLDNNKYKFYSGDVRRNSDANTTIGDIEVVMDKIALAVARSQLGKNIPKH